MLISLGNLAEAAYTRLNWVRVVAPLVRVMDARQAACRRRPQEPVMKVVFPSSPPRSLLRQTPAVPVVGLCPYGS